MKLAKALFLLRKIADREEQLRQIVSDVDEPAIYRALHRRWFVWSGKRWFKIQPITQNHTSSAFPPLP